MNLLEVNNIEVVYNHVILVLRGVGVVMDIADRVVVMDYGKKIGDDTPENILKNQAVIDAYLGVANE